jgi:hypothetical protein
MAMENVQGLVTMLRVQEVGSGYGPANDHLDVEVVFTVSSLPERAFGFQLRTDANRLVRQAMLDLLRMAQSQRWPVSADVETPTGRRNGVVIRVWLRTPSSPTGATRP